MSDHVGNRGGGAGGLTLVFQRYHDADVSVENRRLLNVLIVVNMHFSFISY